MPWRTRFGISAPCRRRRLATALAEDRLDPGDAAPRLTHPRRVFELPARALEAQIEDFLAEHFHLLGQLVRRLAAQIARLHRLHGAPSSPARTTKRVATGNLAAASSNASRAISRSTPSSSNMIRPGFTRAIQYSGDPLPLPMRTSAGLVDTGTSGKMRIQTRPTRRMCRVIARRAASIWRAVMRPGSTDFMP